MLNILKGNFPNGELPASHMMVYSLSGATANAVTSIVSANPYVQLGRLPVLTSNDSSAYQMNLKSFKGEDPAMITPVYISPALVHAMRNFSLPGIMFEIDRLMNIANVYSRTVHRTNIQDELLNMFNSVSGYMLIQAAKHEVKLSSPVPLDTVWMGTSPLSSLKAFIDSKTYKFKYHLGFEPPDQATDGFVAVPPEQNSLIIDEVLSYLVTAFSGAAAGSIGSGDAISAAVPSVSSAGVFTAPSAMNSDYWHHSVLDLILAFQEPEKIAAAIDSCSQDLKLDAIEPYLQVTTQKFFRDTVGAACVLAYYSLAPYLRDLQLFSYAYEHPYYKQRFNDSFINVSDHAQLNAALTWVRNLKLPVLCAAERHQVLSPRVRFGPSEYDATPIEGRTYAKYFTNVQNYLQLAKPGGVLSQLVSFYRVMTNSFFSPDVISKIDASLGKDFGTASTPIVMTPESTADITITDGHRFSRQVRTLADFTRNHVISYKQSATPTPNVTAIVYKAANEVDLRRLMPYVTDVIKLDASGMEKAQDLQKMGLLDCKYPWFFVPKAVLDDRYVLEHSMNPAIKIAPIARAGGPGPNDATIHFTDIEEMGRHLGYYGFSATELLNQPYARRFADLDHSSGSPVAAMMFADAIAGPSALKFTTHSLVNLLNIHQIAEFKLQDHRTGQIMDNMVYPRLLMLVLPDDMFRELAIKDGFEIDPLSNIYAVVQVKPSAFPEII